MKKSFDFLDSFQKELQNIEGVGTSSHPPRFWWSTGNYVLNKIISGSFYKGIPQGRVTTLAGPSGAGKSFLSANIMKAAQTGGAMILVVDSENALDNEFVSKIGVNPTREAGYFYAGVTTIPDASKVISKFLRGYKEQYENDKEAPPALIVVDSLDMMLTETELENYDKGIQKGDQGQRNKQLKQMLRTFVQDIKNLNVAILLTAQVYKNQDVLNGEGVWIVSDAIKFSASQIVLLTKLKLKDKDAGDVAGIRMKCEGLKTRFTKPFQTVVVEVPYDTGMDPYSGLLETALALGIAEKAGSRYRLAGSDDSWYAKDIGEYAEKILLAGEAMVLDEKLSVESEEDMEVETKQERAERRKKKAVEQ